MRGRSRDHRGTSAVVLWTGGKDSALALYDAIEIGLRIESLVTFVPRTGSFKAHPIPLMHAQAASLRLPHRMLVISRPFARAYETALRGLREEGITTLVTGDIGSVGKCSNWIVERATPSGVSVLRPLWNQDRTALLTRMLRVGIRAVVTAVRHPCLGVEWVGRYLDEASVHELRELALWNSFDACGEQGEYHTMTLGGPNFTHSIALDPYEVAQEADLRYLRFLTEKMPEAARSRRGGRSDRTRE